MVRGGLIFLVATFAIVSLPRLSLAADTDGVRIPGLPGVRSYGSDHEPPSARAPQVATPDADIYHEYGTVTPGGGRHIGGLHEGETGRDGRADVYGGTVIGPGGVVKPYKGPAKRAAAPAKTPPTLEEKQAQIRKALVPKPPLAVSRRRTLDDLYSKLAQASDEDESKGLASLIAAVWMRSGSDTADLLMARSDKAVADKKYPLAIQVLDSVVELRPDWAEAWNKRATARYLAGDLNGAMSDVDHVLKLDPNHFGALSGMAMILHRTGFDKRALQIYRRELAVYPHQPDLEKLVETLTLQVEGQGI